MNALRHSGLALVALAAIGLGTPEAKAIAISLDSSFFIEGPDGVTFDPASGNLFVSDGNTITEVSTSGVIIGSPISLFAGAIVNGLDVLPNGNLLLSDQGTSNALVAPALLEFTTAGVAVTGAGSINFVIGPPSGDADGVAFNPVTGTIFVTDDNAETIFEFSIAGALLSSFLTEDILADFDEPEGITIGPTGNLLVVDDSGGTSSLYELTTTGSLVMPPVDLEVLTGFDDPEGVTIDPVDNKLFVSFSEKDCRVLGSTRP